MSSDTALFVYVGPGGEFFPDFHWQPAPGEERELPADTSSPRLERVVRAPKTAPQETA